MSQCALCKETIIVLQKKSLIRIYKEPKPALCQYCTDQLSASSLRSDHFVRNRSHRVSVIAQFHHAGLSQILIQNFKYHRHVQQGRILTAWLLQKIRRHYHCRQYPDVLIPIPTHTQRLVERGFSHTDFLAKRLSKSLHIPILKILSRGRYTQQQAGLSRTQRLQNIKGAFTLDKKAISAYNHQIKCVLIDDVVTTGTTILEAADTLERAYPDIQIDVWCLAHVVKV